MGVVGYIRERPVGRRAIRESDSFQVGTRTCTEIEGETTRSPKAPLLLAGLLKPTSHSNSLSPTSDTRNARSVVYQVGIGVVS